MKAFSSRRMAGIALAAAAWPALASAASIALAAAAWPALASASPLSASARVAPDTLEVGEPAEYTLTITLPKDADAVSVSWNPEPFEILRSATPERKTSGGATVETRRYTIATYQLDRGVVPPPRVALAAGKDTLSAFPDSLRVSFRILRAAGDTTLAALKPPRDFPRRFPWLLLVVLVLAAAALWAAWRLWKKFRPKRKIAARVPAAAPIVLDTRPAHVIALEELDRLEAERLPQQARIREHCTRLSEIARRYLGARFGFDGLDSTSSEVLRALASRPVTAEDRAIVREILASTDWVKFAKGAPAVEEALALLGQARLLVERTRERVLEPTGSAS